MTPSAAPIALVALLLVGPIVRAEPPDAAAERQRIAAARTAAEQRYAERERECRQRFAVTACIDDAQRERRATLGALRREQNLLEEGQRQTRAAERQEMLDERAQAEAARASATAARQPRTTPGGTPEQPHPHATVPGSAPVPSDVLKSPGHLPGGPRPASEEARSRATFDAAQRAAEAHRAEVEAKNARRAASKKPAAPLPVPAASGL
jgi:colicin import membrane protein